MGIINRCPHAHISGIYGDEINHCGGYRLICDDCGRLLDGAVSLAKPAPKVVRTVEELSPNFPHRSHFPHHENKAESSLPLPIVDGKPDSGLHSRLLAGEATKQDQMHCASALESYEYLLTCSDDAAREIRKAYRKDMKAWGINND